MVRTPADATGAERPEEKTVAGRTPADTTGAPTLEDVIGAEVVVTGEARIPEEATGAAKRVAGAVRTPEEATGAAIRVAGAVRTPEDTTETPDVDTDAAAMRVPELTVPTGLDETGTPPV